MLSFEQVSYRYPGAVDPALSCLGLSGLEERDPNRSNHLIGQMLRASVTVVVVAHDIKAFQARMQTHQFQARMQTHLVLRGGQLWHR
jgi:hypothetical protein